MAQEANTSFEYKATAKEAYTSPRPEGTATAREAYIGPEA